MRNRVRLLSTALSRARRTSAIPKSIRRTAAKHQIASVSEGLQAGPRLCHYGIAALAELGRGARNTREHKETRGRGESALATLAGGSRHSGADERCVWGCLCTPPWRADSIKLVITQQRKGAQQGRCGGISTAADLIQVVTKLLKSVSGTNENAPPGMLLPESHFQLGGPAESCRQKEEEGRRGKKSIQEAASQTGSERGVCPVVVVCEGILAGLRK
jgi:hypothetical protein